MTAVGGDEAEVLRLEPAADAENAAAEVACSAAARCTSTPETESKHLTPETLDSAPSTAYGSVGFKGNMKMALTLPGGPPVSRGRRGSALSCRGRRSQSSKSPRSTTGSQAASVKGGNWLLGTQPRVVGLGTTGLFENEKKEADVPEGASAMINGQLIVAPPCCIRRLRDLAMWRDRHRDFIAAFRAQDPLERVSTHRRQQRLFEERHRQQEKEYADEVGRIRQRGKWLNKMSQPADAERQQWLKSRREALQAGREEVVLNNMKKGAEIRENIAKQLVVVKQVKQRRELTARSAARQERDLQGARKEEILSSILERTKVARNDRDTWREFIQEFKNEEDKIRRQYLDQLRCRVLTKSPSDYRDNDGGFTPMIRPPSAPTGDSDKQQFDGTQRSIATARQSTNDGVFRRQFLAELQQQRLEGARAAAGVVRGERSKARRDEALRGNCDRAENLRGEKGMLQERKQQLDKERWQAYTLLREEHALEKKQKEEAVQRMLDEKRESAAAIRMASQWKEAEHRLHEQELRQKLRERAAYARSCSSRGQTPSSVKRTQQHNWQVPAIVS